MNLPYQIIKSNRKTIAIQIKPDGQVIVRCPKQMHIADVRRLAESKAERIQKHLAKVSKSSGPKFTTGQIEQLREQAKTRIAERVQHYAPIVGVSYGRITIRTQHTRWGSCSSKGNLNFNCLLALAPKHVMDYVVVHELCHRKELNHSERFWKEVERVLPDYKAQRKWLRENGNEMTSRL